jgi:imidazolonepropionase
MARTIIFKNISQLMTLRGAVKKSARNIQHKDLGLIKNGAMVVDNGIVSWVGRESSLPQKWPDAKIVDLAGENVFPGFVDCHTHLLFAGDRVDEFESRNRGVSYQEIAEAGGGILATMRATRKASEKDLLQLGQKRVDKFLAQGVTTIEVKSGYGLNQKSELKILKAARQLKKARIVPTFLGAHAIPKEFKNEEAYLLSLEKYLGQVREHCQRIDIFIEKGYFSKKRAREYLQSAKELGFAITIHADQLNAVGATELAIQLQALSADHAIKLSPTVIKKLALSETTAVLLPSADFYIHVDYPKARSLLDGGARCALATDFNPGSSPTQNIGLVGLLARLHMKMTLPEVFVAMTLSGAYALGLENEVGALMPGYKADFFISPLQWREFFYDSLPAPVSAVWVDGKKLRAL